MKRCVRPQTTAFLAVSRAVLLRDFLAAKGVTIEAVGTSNGTTKAVTRGMSDEAVAVAKPYWSLAGCSIDFINAQLEKHGHGPFTRQQLIYKLGKRGTYKDRDE